MRIVIEGLPELLAKIKRIEQLEKVKNAMKAAAVHLKGKMTEYPPSPNRKQPFKTDRQRRGFFAKLRSGDIEVPYRRGASPGSKNLDKQWGIAGRNYGLTWSIGVSTSVVPYARLVQDPDRQTAYHAETGWPTTASVMEAEGPRVIQSITQAINRELQ